MYVEVEMDTKITKRFVDRLSNYFHHLDGCPRALKIWELKCTCGLVDVEPAVLEALDAIVTARR